MKINNEKFIAGLKIIDSWSIRAKMNFLIIRKLTTRNFDNSDFRMLGILSMQSEFLVKNPFFLNQRRKKKPILANLFAC